MTEQRPDDSSPQMPPDAEVSPQQAIDDLMADAMAEIAGESASAGTAGPAGPAGDAGAAGDADAALADNATAAVNRQSPEDMLNPLLKAEIDREVAAAFSDTELSEESGVTGVAGVAGVTGGAGMAGIAGGSAVADADIAAAAAGVDAEALEADREAERIMMEEMLLLESELETQQAEALAKAEVDATARQLAEELQASGGQPPPAATEDVTLPESPESSESPATPVGQVGQVPPVAAAPVVEPEDGPTPEERALLEADLADLPPPSVTASDDDSVAAAATSDGESAASDEHAAAADDSATAEESKADKSAKKKKKDKKSKGGKASEAAAAEDEGNADAVNHPPARSVGAVAGDLSVGALRVMAAILELVDRPFRGLSPDTRDLLGKMAIATFLAAILITIVALLRM